MLPGIVAHPDPSHGCRPRQQPPYEVPKNSEINAKGGYGENEDTVITGTWDVTAEGGEVMLDLYDIGNDEGRRELIKVREGVARLVIKPN